MLIPLDGTEARPYEGARKLNGKLSSDEAHRNFPAPMGCFFGTDGARC